MAKTKTETKETDETKLIKKDIGVFASLEAVKNSEGGQLITKSLKKDILSTIDQISTTYKTANHAELIALSARLSEKIALLRTIFRSSAKKKMAMDELSDVLDEDVGNEE